MENVIILSYSPAMRVDVRVTVDAHQALAQPDVLHVHLADFGYVDPCFSEHVWILQADPRSRVGFGVESL